MVNLSEFEIPDLTGIVDAAPICIALCNSEGQICFVNTVLEKTFGYHTDELVGQSVEMLVPESSRTKHVASRNKFLTEQRSRLMGNGRALRALHADGHEFHVEIGITTMESKKNVYAIAFIIDVSERYKKEQSIRQLMESMPFGLVLTDEHGTIVMTNAELDRIFGYERNTLLDSPIEILVPERLRNAHVGFRAAFTKIKQSRKMGYGRELMAVRKNGLEFPAEIALTPLNDDGKIRLLAAVTDVSKRKQLESTLRRQSLYDSLTSLPNRNLFFDRLDQACLKFARQKTGFALLMIDLNRFKEVNDTLGHPVGDIVLNEVGRRLSLVLRKSDSLARLGGDEFSAILHDIENAEDAVAIAEKMIEALHPPVLAGQHALSVGASIGVALCPEHGISQANLIAHADYAMYQSKRTMSSVVVDGSPEETSLAPVQAIVTEIESALQRREMVFFYQPKINLIDGTLLGLEALIRWQRPGAGIISPIEFIPVIEESSLLEKFTFTSLEMAVSQLNEFQLEGTPIGIAVNLSARMLEHPHLESRLIELLKRFKIQPNLLTLEITETALVINPMKARSTIEILEQYGVQFSIDDFGSGFTSFKYMKTFRIAEIKMDQEFVTALVRNSFDACLIESIASFCKGLNIRLVAEGIESESDQNILLELGCNIGQGYHIARPMPIEEFKLWRVQNVGVLKN